MVFKCQEDSFLKEVIIIMTDYCVTQAANHNVMCYFQFTTTVVSCKKVEEETHEVILLDTILFPEGGGQPCDYGYLNDTYVHNVQREGSLAVHYVKSSTVPFQPGDTVHQKVDWQRRIDFMEQHSGEMIQFIMHCDKNPCYRRSSP
jgi:misacylated tRNA(Ala) deacylase